MILEAGVIVAVTLGVYNFIANASFRSKVEADLTLFTTYVASKSKTVQTIEGKIEGAETEVKKVV